MSRSWSPDNDKPEPYRPALVTLSEDIRGLSEELTDGLESEERALEWLQEVTIRTLGELDSRVYQDMTRQFRSSQGLLLAALLRPSARSADLSIEESKATQVRERLLARYVHPAHRSAFRELRTNATEYTREASEGDAHNPERQNHIAMRPALSELEKWQQRALTELLDGFEEVGEILDWGHDVLLATHGELSRDWVTRVVEERSTVETLLSDSRADARARRLFASHHLMPRYRAGIRVLSRRAAELPSEDVENKEVQFA